MSRRWSPRARAERLVDLTRLREPPDPPHPRRWWWLVAAAVIAIAIANLLVP